MSTRRLAHQNGPVPRVLRLFKPYGVQSKFTDATGRPTLADLVDVPNVYGAGRLDADSEGLLLLSDSPRFLDALTHPRHHLPKTYFVQVERIPDATALEQLRRGVVLKDGPTRPAVVERIDAPEIAPRDPPIRYRATVADCWLALTITEGRNRQVRRMTAAVGHPTLRLVRHRVGPITLDGLAPGEWRDLTTEEILDLQDALERRRRRRP
jgi:pseudouridine synthase